MLEFLLVITARNEEDAIAATIKRADKVLGGLFQNYHIAVVDASSIDNTVGIVNALAEKNGRLSIITGRTPHAKGSDIMYGFSKYESRIYGFIDADMAQSLADLPKMVKNINATSYGAVIGSRYTGNSKINRSKIRLAVSKSYNMMLSLLFNDHIADHQCGFKLFNRKAERLLLKHSVEAHWPWDTEAVLICERNGINILEVPIRWHDTRARGNIYDIKRSVKDIIIFIVPILRMFYRFRISRQRK